MVDIAVAPCMIIAYYMLLPFRLLCILFGKLSYIIGTA